MLALAASLVVELASQTRGARSAHDAVEGRPARASRSTLVNNQEFVAVDDLAATFQLAVREDALGALTITYKDKTIVLTNQALASVAGRLVSLPAPAARAGRRWLVPVEFINRALALDLRHEARPPQAVASADRRRPSRAARDGPLRSRCAGRTPDDRRDAARQRAR